MVKLREYQNNAREAVLREWEDHRSTLVVLPTGTGKTVMFSAVADGIAKRVLVLAHREELIWQAREKIAAVAGGSVEVEMADHHAVLGAHVIVATVQSLVSVNGDGRARFEKFPPHEFGLVIVDEAHHATAATYRRVLDHFRGNPDLRVLGVTATPDRADEQALGQIFDSVAFDYEITDAITDAWLVPIEEQIVNVTGLDYSTVSTVAGDLNGGELARVLEEEKILHRMAGPSIEIIGQRRAIIFCASVKQAEQMSDILNRHRPGMAGWVCGATDKDDRRALLRRFRAHEVQVVCNCAVLTEGFDDPGVEVVVMGKPTKSRSLYAQMCGRAMRPLPAVVDGLEYPEQRRDAIARSGKTSCLIVDFAGNAGRHKLITSADILGGDYSDEAIEAATRVARESGRAVQMAVVLEEEEKKAEEERKRAEERKAAEAARRAGLIAKARYQVRRINPFDAFQLHPARTRGWDQGKQLSEKQKALLARQGLDPDMPYAQGRQVINELFRRWSGKLCTLKQAATLRRYGYPTDCTMDEASKILDVLAKNNWQRI